LESDRIFLNQHTMLFVASGGSMPHFCTSCGSGPVDDTASFCPACGRPVLQIPDANSGAAPVSAPVVSSTGGLSENVAGMLAYVTIIPAIVFLLVAPYNRNRFIRFHSFQCIFLVVAVTIIHLALAAMPVIGWALSSLVSLVFLALWVVLLIKAYQGQVFKVPVIGDIAEKQANTI
jgi:uncharacterized membrane protein